MWYANQTHTEESIICHTIHPHHPQGRCRSCYAFATTGVLEGLHALTTGKMVTLSEQNIIDCSSK